MKKSCLTVALILAACTEKQTSQPKHVVGSVSNNANSTGWVVDTPEYFIRYRQAIADNSIFTAGEKLSYLPPSNAMTRFTQFHLSRIHAHLVDQGLVPVSIPEPRAFVLVDPTANASVWSVPVCVSFPVKIEGLFADPSLKLQGGYLNLGPANELADLPCIERAANESEIQQYLANWLPREKCGWSMSEGTLTIPASCPINSMATHYSGILVNPTINLISVHSGLIQKETEETFVGVLAHELGHYYRMHASMLSGERLSFYYKLDEAYESVPSEDPAFAHTLDKLQSLIKLIADLDDPLDVKLDKHYDVQTLTNQDLEILYNLTTASGPDLQAVCNLSPEKASDLDRQHFRNWRLKKMDAFAVKEFEALLSSCAARIPATDTIRLIFSFDAEFYPYFQAEDLQSYQTVFELVQAMPDLRARLASKRDDAKREFADLQTKAQLLGWYTDEQEADELGTEIAIRAGFSREAVLSFDLNRADETCKTLYKNGFKDEQGRALIIPIEENINDLLKPSPDMHHANCFRVFNLYHELQRHKAKYDALPAAAPAPSPMAWDELQKIDVTDGIPAA